VTVPGTAVHPEVAPGGRDDRGASVVIGNYNYGRFLGRAIDSALGQTHSRTEVVVVDDGSTDCSREVLAGYGDRVVAVLQENAGMASTYNAGFRRSRGHVVVFLDADDMLLPTAVERALRCFDAPDVAKVHWPLLEVDGSGAPTGGVVPPQSLAEGDLRDAVLRHGPDAYLSPPTSGNAWARAFLRTVLPMPEPEFRQHADVYLTTLAAVFGRVRRVAEPLGYYRVHGSNDYASKPADEKTRRNLEIYERRCRALSRYLEEREGRRVDPATWMRPGTPYAWTARLHAAMAAVKAVVPPGATYILVDDQQWGERRGGADILTDRRSFPFLERDGQYYGPPPDDGTAIRELERLREAGAGYAVFAWPAFWWLAHYAEFGAYLKARYPTLVETDAVVVFDTRR
jgi:hypothetical protein